MAPASHQSGQGGCLPPDAARAPHLMSVAAVARVASARRCMAWAPRSAVPRCARRFATDKYAELALEGPAPLRIRGYNSGGIVVSKVFYEGACAAFNTLCDLAEVSGSCRLGVCAALLPPDVEAAAAGGGHARLARAARDVPARDRRGPASAAICQSRRGITRAGAGAQSCCSWARQRTRYPSCLRRPVSFSPPSAARLKCSDR
jgi:hypothetical protein